MTRLNTVRAILIVAFCYFSTDRVRGQINAGGGLAYGTETETLGFNLRGGGLINENFSVSAGYTHFLPRRFDEGGINYIKLWEINLEASYWFYLIDNFIFYPSAGIKIMEFTVEHTYTLDSGETAVYKSTGDRTGLVLGGGGGYRIGNVTPFIEGKVVYYDFELESSFALGVLIFFN